MIFLVCVGRTWIDTNTKKRTQRDPVAFNKCSSLIAFVVVVAFRGPQSTEIVFLKIPFKKTDDNLKQRKKYMNSAAETKYDRAQQS